MTATPWRALVAPLGEESRDRQWLDPAGHWRLPAWAPLTYLDRAVGRVTHLRRVGGALYALGTLHPDRTDVIDLIDMRAVYPVPVLDATVVDVEIRSPRWRRRLQAAADRWGRRTADELWHRSRPFVNELWRYRAATVTSIQLTSSRPPWKGVSICLSDRRTPLGPKVGWGGLALQQRAGLTPTNPSRGPVAPPPGREPDECTSPGPKAG